VVEVLGGFAGVVGAVDDEVALGASAEEFAQETFVKAYVHADKYRTVARFSTWLYTIATNLVRNRVRNVKRRPAVVSLWSEDAGGRGRRQVDGLEGRFTEARCRDGAEEHE
jgi:DNA-directed RNA polymerase specialized sigma24 family protein